MTPVGQHGSCLSVALAEFEVCCGHVEYLGLSLKGGSMTRRQTEKKHVDSMGWVECRRPGARKTAMAVASLLGQKSGKGKGKVRE